MGVTLGLIGAGGSILTVPILVAFFDMNTEVAISYSLYVVGATAALAALLQIKQKMIDFRLVIIFSIFSFPTVYAVRHWIFPLIPDPVTLHLFGQSLIDKPRPTVLMILFSLLMMAASKFMIQRPPADKTKNLKKAFDRNDVLTMKALAPIAISAMAVGTLTGLLGSGGGFVMIPIFVKALRLTMKAAVATSLTLITLNSAIGILSEPILTDRDDKLLGWIVASSLVGLLIAMKLTKQISDHALRRTFGFFVLILGFVILMNSLL